MNIFDELVSGLERKSEQKGVARVLVILDESGSMSNRRSDVIGGYNAYIERLLRDPEYDYRFSTLLFTTNRRTWLCRDAERPVMLSEENYLPSAGTPLLDAVGAAISETAPRVGEPVFVVIVTDGEENESREWTKEKVQDLIRIRGEADWQFIFLGADVSAWTGGFQTLGVTIGGSFDGQYDRAFYYAAAQTARSARNMTVQNYAEVEKEIENEGAVPPPSTTWNVTASDKEPENKS